MRLFFSIISSIFWITYGTFFILGLIVGSSSLQHTFLPFKSFIVRSGSMEPTIMTGDLIFVSPQSPYKINDVVTFTDAEKQVITHRIISSTSVEKKTSFETKGDNNKTKDPAMTEETNIIGGFRWKLPKAGIVLLASKRPVGMTLMIALPIIFIIGSELFKHKPMKNEQK